ncbi:hypothetical protein [Pseudomonas alabamensis]|uniref:hypothetical protein n=1 Tax=Pseudomonas alabamensis TaxID=3064349 RepID=UPI003F6528EF
MKLINFKVIRLILSGALLGVTATNAFGGIEGIPEIVGGVIGAGGAALLCKFSVIA